MRIIFSFGMDLRYPGYTLSGEPVFRSGSKGAPRPHYGCALAQFAVGVEDFSEEHLYVAMRRKGFYLRFVVQPKSDAFFKSARRDTSIEATSVMG